MARDEDAPADGEHGSGRYFVKSVERALTVIRVLGPEAMTVPDVAREAGLTRATARRFLLTLADLGYVHSDGRTFWLRPRVLELGYAYLSGLSLPDVALPHLEELVAVVRESSEASVLDGEDIVYILRVPASRIVTVSVNVGARMPAHATSMGRVLLASLTDTELDAYFATATLQRYLPNTLTSPAALRDELEIVRRNGWAIVDQELEEGLRAVATPIRDRDGHVLAAANLSTNAPRRSLDSLREDLLPKLLATTAAIEEELRISGPHTRRQRPPQNMSPR